MRRIFKRSRAFRSAIIGAHFEAIDYDNLLMAPSDFRYTQVGFKLISAHVDDENVLLTGPQGELSASSQAELSTSSSPAAVPGLPIRSETAVQQRPQAAVP